MYREQGGGVWWHAAPCSPWYESNVCMRDPRLDRGDDSASGPPCSPNAGGYRGAGDGAMGLHSLPQRRSRRLRGEPPTADVLVVTAGHSDVRGVRDGADLKSDAGQSALKRSSGPTTDELSRTHATSQMQRGPRHETVPAGRTGTDAGADVVGPPVSLVHGSPRWGGIGARSLLTKCEVQSGTDAGEGA